MTVFIQEAASALASAYSGTALPPLRFETDDHSQEAAYAIQELNTERWIGAGRRLIGRKIGLTSAAVQKQFGVDEPDYGMLYADSAYFDGAELPVSKFMQPKVEAEIAFVLGRDLETDGDAVTPTRLVSAIEYAVAAIEIVDSRIANWDISLFDTIADNASFGAFVTGSRPVPLSRLDLSGCKMSLEQNGECVSAGQGSACLGNPLNAMLWLARKMAAVGRPLKQGDVVLSGALGPIVQVASNAVYSAFIDGLGPVSIQFTE